MVISQDKGILVLFEPGKTEQIFEVGEKPITIGRSRQNDITLENNSVSKRHATIRYTSHGWFVADLGSTNGTQLNGRQLPSHKPFPWRQGHSVRIGKYAFEFRLDPFSIIPLPTTPKTDPSLPLVSSTARQTTLTKHKFVAQPIVTTTPIACAKIRLAVSSNFNAISIGEYQTFQVELHNGGDASAKVTLQQMGLPLTWITLPYRTLQVEAGQVSVLTIALHPPATKLSKPGNYQLMLKAIGADGYELNKLELQVQVTGTGRFLSQLKPGQLKDTRQGKLLLKNVADAPAKFSLQLSDEDNELALAGPLDSFRLDTQEQQVVCFKIDSQQRPFFGRERLIPFSLTVHGPGRPQQHEGLFQQQPVVPVWLLSLAALFVMMMLITGMLVASNWELFNEQIVASLAAMAGDRPLLTYLLSSLWLQPF